MDDLTQTAPRPSINPYAGPIPSCGHTSHTDIELRDCLAAAWGMSTRQLIATLQAILFADAEYNARDEMRHQKAARDGGRRCLWCKRPLPEDAHPKRDYCKGTACRRRANAERNSSGARRARQQAAHQN